MIVAEGLCLKKGYYLSMCVKIVQKEEFEWTNVRKAEFEEV